MSQLERAIVMAAKAHAGQVGGDGQPHLLHPLRMMLAVEGQDEKIAAVLHDVFEGGMVSVDELLGARIPPLVVNTLIALAGWTDADHESSMARVKANPVARAVKIADLRDMLSLGDHGAMPSEVRQKLESDLKRLECG